ncbi:NEL-type E3 ubiquitin ligase domain-containing protein, partial [Pseudomonas sp. DSP3-2-2]|uniref:NEL-type E3 ubiquitin ligase domain-containing protein n=1 Tax=unclassified Pseudomonas TaxID=196821 RepID=UPI003CEFFB28
PSSFVESLASVKLPNGLTRLWKPDLARFRQKVVLPSRAAADAQGLIKAEGKTWLPLAGAVYRIEFDTALNKWRVEHPGDLTSHSPVLEHNGEGVWRFEGENPMGWDETVALRRLSSAHEAFADETLQHVLRATGADEALLRQVHVENLPAPALLSVTLQRFGIEQQVENFITLMSGSNLDQVSTVRIEPFLKLLTSSQRWPLARGLRLLDEQNAVLESWNITHNSTSAVQVTYKPGGMTALLDTLLKSLLPEEVASLLGEEVESRQAQIFCLARNLSELAQAHKGQLFDELYALDEPLDDPLIKLIRRDFPDMPNAIARELVDSASPAQRQRMATAKRIPLPIAEQAREYQQQLRLNRANEGFYRAVTNNPDTFKAGFGLLPDLPGWPADLAIELHDGSLDGVQLDMLGSSQSTQIRQVLVKTDAGYQTFRSDSNRIGRFDQTFFEALLQALPDWARRDIGLPAAPTERDLRVLLGDYAATRRGSLTHLLNMQPVKPGFVWPYRLADGRVGYPMSGRLRGLFKMLGMGAHDYSPELAIKALYPGFIDDEVHMFLNQMRTGYTGEPWGFNAFAKARLKLLGKEYKALEKTLDDWLGCDRTAPGSGSAVSESTYEARAAVAIRLKLGWKKMGMRRYNDMGEFIGYELDLSDLSVSGLPELHASFDHIGVLRAERLGLTTTQAQQLLKPFKNLRRLGLDSNELTALPAALGQQRNLQELSLRDNPLILDAASAQHLGNLTSLRILRLDNCPIGSQLNLRPLTGLVTLGLRFTGIDALPNGLWDCFVLHTVDLRNNQIVTLSDASLSNLNRGYVRVQMHDNPLDEDSLLRASALLSEPTRTRLGIDDARVHAEQQPGADAGWMENVAAADKPARIVRWEDLEAEPNAEDFFRVLHDLIHSSDFAQYQKTLSLRVWALLDVIAENRALREEVYALAMHPQTCSDGVAMVFSDLELHVRIFRIMALPGIAEHPARMYKLVRGLARLDDIEKVALENIRIRELLGETVDHVEVRMAFRTGLESRLELPEQVRSMMFLALAGVSKPMLADAEARVLAREGEPTFFHSLVQRDFWKQFLEQRFSQRFETLNAPFYERLDALHDRRSELSDGEYLEQVAAIQRERQFEVEADAIRLTEDIARQITRRESVAAGPSNGSQ